MIRLMLQSSSILDLLVLSVFGYIDSIRVSITLHDRHASVIVGLWFHPYCWYSVIKSIGVSVTLHNRHASVIVGLWFHPYCWYSVIESIGVSVTLHDRHASVIVGLWFTRTVGNRP
ncbi:hypothetical protein CDAR_434961 [Caerostris darwini]|uniref:Uncharacterized protein n=1 Tax=Caerostris darwini TaxID=1538125 RepID=A0AAV4QGL5_9ARAC|nr:hypothetical protein CDAR_434961 [Caerostris darwini]